MTTKFEVIENFILICQRAILDGNQTTNEVFSPRISWRNMWILSTNVQTRWKSLENLRLQISINYANFHRSATFIFSLGLVDNSTVHTICGYMIAAGQITHRIPAISNWDFWFCRFKRVWLQAEFFEVIHSLNFWLIAWRRQRFAGGHFAK